MAVGRKTGGWKKAGLNKVKPGVTTQQVFQAKVEEAMASSDKSMLEITMITMEFARVANQLADKIAELLADELQSVDREVAASALLTLACRLRQEGTENGPTMCRAKPAGHYGQVR
jgi:hypothetical protein